MLMLHHPLPDIAGAVCDAVLVQAYYYRGRLVSEANALFLRLRESGWQRIFIEAGIVFWEAVDGLDSPDQDRHHYTLSDLGAAHGFTGKRLLGVTTVDLPSGGELRLAFEGAPGVIYRNADGASWIAVGKPADQSPR